MHSTTPSEREIALQAQRDRASQDYKAGLPFGANSRPYVPNRTEIDADLDRAYRDSWQQALAAFRKKVSS